MFLDFKVRPFLWPQNAQKDTEIDSVKICKIQWQEVFSAQKDTEILQKGSVCEIKWPKKDLQPFPFWIPHDKRRDYRILA